MTDDDEIAVIGLACRFPGADDAAAFWHNLVSGTESVRAFSTAEVVARGEDPTMAERPDYVAARAVLDGPELFDAELLGYTGREAELTDPQQRLLAETVWRAFEDAGYPPGPRHPTGLFVGARPNRYAVLLERAGQVDPDLAGDLRLRAGCETDFLATRVAYKLDLRGPALTVQAACSSSLLAVHLAARALRDGDCEIALAGGVSVQVPPVRGYRYEPGLVESADGHCRPYDDAATGTTSGDGVGVVVLRRLADALRDGDQIHAVLRGSAVNNDGADKLGFTAPSVAGHVAVARAALDRTGLYPSEVSYVEGHGTATRLGDPMELRALHEVYGRDREPGSCLIGSVKSNIGHLDSAAGIAGLIKTVLAVRHAVIPASLNVGTPNTVFAWEKSGLRIATDTSRWAGTPRVAAVSSLGMGGTNVHVIVGEPPRRADRRTARGWQAVLLSARTEDTLRELAGELAKAVTGKGLADVAGTLRAGRHRFAHRCAVIAPDTDALADALTAWSAGEHGAPFVGDTYTLVAGTPSSAGCVFRFADGGAPDGAELYAAEPDFAAALDVVADTVACAGGRDPRDVLLRGAEPTDSEHVRTALLAWQYATATALITAGVRPSGLIASGNGELAAACVAGTVSPREAVRIALGGDGDIPVSSASGAVDGAALVHIGPDRLGSGHDAARGFVEALATLWVTAGIEPVRPEPFRRVSLPGHPMRRRRFWYAEPVRPVGPPPPAPHRPAVAELTELVVAVYEDVLGTGVAPDDDFYALGGDSLAAVQGAGRVGDALGVEVTADDFLEHPTAASLAAHLRRGAPVEGAR